MFDLFGAIPLDNHSVPTNPQPFKHLHGNEKIRFRETRVSVNGQHWWMLHNSDVPATFEDEDILVLIHGNCYPILDGNADIKRKKLLPRELAEKYRQSGNDVMRGLKGSFVIVVADRSKNKLNVYTDPLNLRTAYYTLQNGNLLISTSTTAIANYASAIGASMKVDKRAMLDLFLFDFTLDDHTFLQDVRELGPGSRLSVSDGKLSVTKWFDAFREFNLSGKTMNAKDGAKLVRTVLSDNIQLYNEGPENTAVALTGGFDSRSIAALLNGPMSDFTFFSYGSGQSWDVSIPQTIARRLNLKYLPIDLGQDYRTSFSEYSDLAVQLSDGAAEYSHANIPYVYSNFLLDKTSILTGLFGSELIKTPSSRGLFLDTNSIALLSSNNPADTMHTIFTQMDESGIDLPFSDKETREEMIEMVRNHPYINNDLPSNEKFFYYMLMVGVRKYFRKETKIQRFWKNNLHPFFDIEFIGKLLETPFPWVYNFSQQKSLIKNISIHKLYGSIIHENPQLSDIVSTHGYRPRHLVHPLGIPMIALEYFMNKKKISAASSLSFQKDLALKKVHENKAHLFSGSQLDVEKFISSHRTDTKNIIKVASAQSWLRSVGLSM